MDMTSATVAFYLLGDGQCGVCFRFGKQSEAEMRRSHPFASAILRFEAHPLELGSIPITLRPALSLITPFGTKIEQRIERILNQVFTGLAPGWWKNGGLPRRQ